MELKHFLQTAVRVTSALAELHRKNIIHLNLRPHNIVVDAESGKVELRSAAKDAPSHGQDSSISRPRILAEILPYISPEQTGRMSRQADHRSDLYSLGVVFYEWLSGVLPFQA